MEPLYERWIITDEFRFDCLDGASGFQEFVMRLVDNSHPAFTEPVFKNILAIEGNAAGQGMEGRASVTGTPVNNVVITAKTGGAFSHVG
jgi:hypothetical protein